MTTARRYLDDIQITCYSCHTNFTTPLKVIAQGYDGLLPACRVVLFADSAAAEVSQLSSRMQEIQIICALGPVLAFAANAADHSSLTHISTSPLLRKQLCCSSLTLALMQPYHSTQLGNAPAFKYILLSAVQRTTLADMASVGQCALRSL